MITSDERRKRAKRLMVWYESVSVGAVILLLLVLFLHLQFPKEFNFNQALVFRRKILIPTQDPRSNKVSVRAFDLDTGRVRDTEFAPPDSGWVTDGEHLWSIGLKEIVETDGTTSKTFRPNRGLNELPFREFLYDGKPAVIDRTVTLQGIRSYHLLVLTDGDWRDVGRIATPGSNRVWMTPDSGEEPTLLPRTSELNSFTRFDAEQMTVIPCATWHR